MKRPTASYHEVLEEMRGFLKAQRFTQVPQLSTEHFLKLSECFMPEAQRRAQAQLQAAPAPTRAPVRKALTVGINYYCLPKDAGGAPGFTLQVLGFGVGIVRAELYEYAVSAWLPCSRCTSAPD